MRKFDYKYRIDEEHKTVVARSTFAGRTVVGIARCAPEDTFNVDSGKKLAAARCALKIAEKRMKRAEDCLSVANEAVEYWTRRQEQMKAYETDSVNAYTEAVTKLASLEKSFE